MSRSLMLHFMLLFGLSFSGLSQTQFDLLLNRENNNQQYLRNPHLVIANPGNSFEYSPDFMIRNNVHAKLKRTMGLIWDNSPPGDPDLPRQLRIAGYNYSNGDPSSDKCEEFINKFLIKDLDGGDLSKVSQYQTPTIKVFPNPFSDKVHIELNGNSSAVISLHSMRGRAIKIEEFIMNTGTVSISLAQLPAGVYILQVHSRDGSFYHRLIKK